MLKYIHTLTLIQTYTHLYKPYALLHVYSGDTTTGACFNAIAPQYYVYLLTVEFLPVQKQVFS